MPKGKRTGPPVPYDYQFTTGATRPAPAPHPRERHTKLVEAILATAADGSAVVVAAPEGVDPKRMASTFAQAVRKAIRRGQLQVSLFHAIMGRTISLWAVSTAADKSAASPPASSASPAAPAAPWNAPAGTAPGDPVITEAVVLAQIRAAGADGLMAEEIGRTLLNLGRREPVPPRHLRAIRAVLAGLSRAGKLLVDGAERYSLKGVA